MLPVPLELPCLEVGFCFAREFFSMSNLLLALGLPFVLCFREFLFTLLSIYQQDSTLVIWCFLACCGKQAYPLSFSLSVSLKKPLCLWASGLWSSQCSCPSPGDNSGPCSDPCSAPKVEVVFFPTALNKTVCVPFSPPITKVSNCMLWRGDRQGESGWGIMPFPQQLLFSFLRLVLQGDASSELSPVFFVITG